MKSKLNITTSIIFQIVFFIGGFITIYVLFDTINNYNKTKKNISEIFKYKNTISHWQKVEKVNLLFNNFVDLTTNLGVMFSNLDSIPQSYRRTFISKTLYSIIEQKPEIYSIWSIFKPFSLDTLDNNYANQSNNLTGQYVINYYQLGEKILTKEVDVSDYLKLNNNIALFQKTKVVIKYAVNDIYTLLNKKNYVFQIIAPVVVNKSVIGIVGVDIDYRMISSIFNSKSSYFIINENLDIVFSYNLEHINKNLKTLYQKINNSRIYRYIISNQIVSDKEQLTNNKSNQYYTLIPLYIKETNRSFFYISILEEKEILKTQFNNYSLNIIMPIFFVILVLLILTYLAIRISNNLRIVNTEIENSLKKSKFYKYKKELKSKEYLSIFQNIENLKIELEKYESFIDELLKDKYEINIDSNKETFLSDKLLKLKTKIYEERQSKEKQIKQQEQEALMNRAIGDINNLQLAYINDMENLVYEIIKYISDFTVAVQGGFYLADEDEKGTKYLTLLAFYSYNRKVFYKKRIEYGDGLAGTCAKERKPIYTNVPPNYLEIKSGFGALPPEYIFLVPLVHTNEVLGIMEFAFIKSINEFYKNFIISAANVVASAIFTSETTFKTDKLLKETEKIKKELEDKEIMMKNQIEQLEQFKKKSEEIELDLSAIIATVEKILYYAEMDVNSNILSINSLLSYKLQIQTSDAMLLNYYDLFYIEDRELHKSYWQKVLEGKIIEFELPIILGKFNIWMKCALSPVYNIQRKIYKVVFFGIDISDLKIKEEELQNIKFSYEEKLEQLNVQEAEMDFIFNDYQVIQDNLTKKNEEIGKKQQELDKVQNSYEFLQKEFQKRISHYSRIENNLKDRIKQLEEEITRLGGNI